MCYIMIVKQLKGDSSPVVEDQIRKVLTAKKDLNDDGFFFRNGEDVIRTLDDKIATKAVKESTINNLMVHFRMASVGAVSEENVHGWEIGDWVFFHNGGISNYSQYKYKDGQEVPQDQADSYLFFQDLYMSLEGKHPKDKVVSNAIEKLLASCSFWGRAALYNKATDRLFLFGDFWVYTFGTSYITFSSSVVNFDHKISRNLHGIKVDYGNPSVIGETKVDGIGVITNFSTDHFQYKNLLKNFKTNSRYTTPFVHHHFDQKDWDYENGIYRRKHDTTTTGLRQVMLPAGVSAEKEEMVNNINEQLDDLELDLGKQKPAPNLTPYTEEELEKLMDNKEFAGWSEFGIELYKDQYGYHDQYGQCCYAGDCILLNQTEGIVFKEEVATQEQRERMGFKVWTSTKT